MTWAPPYDFAPGPLLLDPSLAIQSHFYCIFFLHSKKIDLFHSILFYNFVEDPKQFFFFGQAYFLLTYLFSSLFEKKCQVVFNHRHLSDFAEMFQIVEM